MAATLPPDPYKALGVAKDADAAAIKCAYRKLVLKCHPDKVTDETLKQQKQEEFHKIQQAYELIGDEEKRATHDAEVRLDQLRKEKLARTGGSPNAYGKSARYDVRTAEPAGAAFKASGSARYEERKPSSRSYDEERWYEERSRKYDAYPKQSSSSRSARPEKETPTKTSRAFVDRSRSDTKKTRDRDERRERSSKFVHMDDESSSDEKVHYEADWKKRTEQEEARRLLADARRKAEDRRSYEETRHDRQRKLSDQESEAFRYIHRSKGVESETRPSASRTTSSRDVRPEHYESRSSRRERPESVRRSSARPRDRPSPPSSGRERDRERGFPEIVEWGEDRTPPPPSFKQSSSSPADIHVPRTTPQRSFTTEVPRDPRRTDTSPPAFRRSETMPTSHGSSSRRKEPVMTRPSTLRSSETVTPYDSSSSNPDPAFSTVPTPQSQPSSAKTTKYYYNTPGGGVRLSPEDMGVANGHRTVLREPDRHHTRSPSPHLTRPPMGSNRPPEKISSRPPPPLSRSATMNVNAVREERGRSSRPPLYGEVGSEFAKRENARRQSSFSPDQINFVKKYGPEDIRWSGGRDPARDNLERDREYRPTTLGRTATSVY
ncbi:hypothetical protein BDV95DRAFT_591005 [Massariosphaeria phaeospora]|uniref:J domain-containing protein n=1 Tax=Massariosphaeria phaeospora TaxID=100035 RepID=A0A7C8IBI9_9PLEO|nr:hypothetical protein BDV95DRAFT_591005 [Massariosphaeria phaeospora]